LRRATPAPTPGTQDLLEQAFFAEAAELLQIIEQNLFSLLDEKTTENVHTLMRSAHTIKGSAASLGLETIKTIAHHLEDVFQALYAPELEIDPEVGALLLDGYECLRTPLSASMSGLPCNEAEILDRTASVFAKLQEKLGDFFGREAPLPSSEELGFDVVGSIFSGSVVQDLAQLEAALTSLDPEHVQATLRSQADFFVELAASYSLPGLAEIAQTTLSALKQHPDKVIEIAQVAINDFKQAQAAISAGDRTQGGEVSLTLREWAGEVAGVEDKNKETSRQEEAASTITLFSPTPPAPLLSSSTPAPPAPPALFPASPIDRILQSIWPGDPENTYRSPHSSAQDKVTSSPSAPSLETQSSASLPNIRVTIEQLDRLSHTVGELLINENQQTLQSDQIHQAAQDTLQQFLHCQQQLSKLRDWSDKNLLPSENKQQRQRNIAIASKRPIVNIFPTHRADSEFDALEMDSYNDLYFLLQNLTDNMVCLEERIEVFETFVQQFRLNLGKRKQLLLGAQEDLLQARMVSLRTVLNRFPRILQQMVASHHKPTELKLIGMGVLVDKAISEKLYEPLLHLIRNSFDHGIESADIRRQRGKPETGQITIHAYHQGNRTIIEVRDDGHGLNWERIRQRALKTHLFTQEQAVQASETQLAEVLFEPGFSTAEQISDLSGRGIGLDVVRNQLHALQGLITVHSVSGQGTTFTLQLPLSLTTARLLVCQSQGIIYGLVSEGVNQVLLPQPDQIQVQQSMDGHGNQKFLQWKEGQNKQLVPIRLLADLLHYEYPLLIQDKSLTLSPFPVKPRNSIDPLLLLQIDNQWLCLQVEQILVEQELVVKSLGSTVTLPSHIQGYSVLGDGSLTLVIDPTELVRQSYKAVVPSSPQRLSAKLFPAPKPVLALEGSQLESTITAHAQHVIETNTTAGQPGLSVQPVTVLIIEDSAVQRQSLVLTLQKAGYQVLQAVNGQEGITQLHQHTEVDLVISDIEMPQMNGFEFLEHRRQDNHLSRIPVVMLTTRSGKKHRQLALNLGAQAYLTKPYSEQDLLTTLAKLSNTH